MVILALDAKNGQGTVFGPMHNSTIHIVGHLPDAAALDGIRSGHRIKSPASVETLVSEGVKIAILPMHDQDAIRKALALKVDGTIRICQLGGATKVDQDPLGSVAPATSIAWSRRGTLTQNALP